MITGALIFAYNNEAFDYVRMAELAASRVRRHLGIPVAVVTDSPTNGNFDQVVIHSAPARDSRWFPDAKMRAIWHNHTRPDAWDLTPWDRTLLIDADMVVASDRLKVLLDHASQSVLCHRSAYDVTGINDFSGLGQLGRYAWPLAWATVMIFDRSAHAQAIFACMKMVRSNWTHYRQIYHESSPTYRNDHALTIAQNMANGHTPTWPTIPWSLATVMPEHQITQTDVDRYRIDFVRADNRLAWVEVQGIDLHVMGKRSLGTLTA